MSEIYRHKYPMIRQAYTDFNDDGPFEALSWKPGVRFEVIGEPYDGITEAVADGVGEQILTVVSRHRPSPKYPERVFFIQQFVSPDGHTFGKTKLRTLTAEAFKRRAAGFRYSFEIDAPRAAVEAARKVREGL